MANQRNILAALRRKGIAKVPDVPWIGELTEFLGEFQEHDGHVNNAAKAAPANGTSHYKMRDILRFPKILPFALGYQTVVEDYLEEPALLYSINGFWTRPAKTARADLNELHRDYDDRKFVALFVYGTDVLKPNDGAHQLQCDDVLTTMLGPAGTAFFADTRNLHRGMLPKKRARLIFWFRWGVSNPPASYKWDKLRPVSKKLVGGYPTERKLRSKIKLVCA